MEAVAQRVVGTPVFSRPNRVYATLHPVALRVIVVSVGVVGDIGSRQSPSDDHVVRVVFRCKKPHHRGSSTLLDCSASGFEASMHAELKVCPIPRNRTTRMNILQKAACRAKGCAQMDALAANPLIQSAHLAHCLRVLSAIQARREEQARQLCRLHPTYVAFAEREVEALISGVRVKLRNHVDSQTRQEVAAVEA